MAALKAGITPDSAAASLKSLKDSGVTFQQSQSTTEPVADERIDELGETRRQRLDAVNNVESLLKNYRSLYDQYTGGTGVQLTGKEAAELRTAKSNLEFAIANAVGTGALQEADRAVVRDLLPDPTSFRGSLGIITRGGKEGTLSAIDQAISQFGAMKETMLSGISSPVGPQTAATPQPEQTTVQNTVVQPEVQAPQPEQKSGLGEFAKGVGKSVLSSLQGASDIGQRIFGGTADRILETAGMELSERERAALPERFTEAEGGAQKAGKIVGDIAQLLIPGTNGLKVAQLSKATGMSGRLIASIAKEAPSSIAASGVTAAQEGETDDIFQNALLFGTLNKLGSAASRMVSSATKDLPGKLVDTALKPSLDEARRAILYGGKTLGQELVERGISGSDRKILETALKNLNESEDKLQTILAGSKETITKDELVPYLSKLLETKGATPGLRSEAEKIASILDDIPEVLTLTEANAMKRNLYAALSDTAFKLDASLNAKRDAMKAIARGLKSEIEKKTNAEFGDAVKKINKDLSVFGRTRDAVVDKLARSERNNILSLGSIGAGAAGAAAAGASGIAAGILAKSTLGSTVAKTKTASALKKFGDAIDNIPTDRAGKITKAALYKALESALGD